MLVGLLAYVALTPCYIQIDLTSSYPNFTFKKYLSLPLGDGRFSSGLKNHVYKHGRIIASWAGKEEEIALGASSPARVKSYFEHSFELDGKCHIVLHVLSGSKNTAIKFNSVIHQQFIMLRFLNS